MNIFSELLKKNLLKNQYSTYLNYKDQLKKINENNINYDELFFYNFSFVYNKMILWQPIKKYQKFLENNLNLIQSKLNQNKLFYHNFYKPYLFYFKNNFFINFFIPFKKIRGNEIFEFKNIKNINTLDDLNNIQFQKNSKNLYNLKYLYYQLLHINSENKNKLTKTNNSLFLEKNQKNYNLRFLNLLEKISFKNINNENIELFSEFFNFNYYKICYIINHKSVYDLNEFKYSIKKFIIIKNIKDIIPINLLKNSIELNFLEKIISNNFNNLNQDKKQQVNNLLLNKNNINKSYLQQKNKNFLNIKNIRNLWRSIYIFQWKLINNYRYLIFTLEWWNLVTKYFFTLSPVVREEIKDLNKIYKDHLQSQLKKNTLKSNRKIFNNILKFFDLQLENQLLNNLFSKNQNIFFEEIRNFENNYSFTSLREYTKLNFSNYKNFYIIFNIFNLFIIYNILFFFIYNLPTIIGSRWLYLWFQTELLKDLISMSWTEKQFFAIYKKRKYPSRKKSKALSVSDWDYFKYFVMYPKIQLWFLRAKTLEINTEENDLLKKSIITNKQLYKEYLQKNNSIFFENARHENYLDKLGKISKNKLILTQNNCPNIILIDKLHKLSSFFHSNFPKFPLLQIHSLYKIERTFPQALLLIGKIEIGKFYLVKKLALDSGRHLIWIDLDYFMFSPLEEILKLEKSYTEDEFYYYSFIEIDASTSIAMKKLGILKNIIKNIGPSIVWIPEIERLGVKTYNLGYKLESNKLFGNIRDIFDIFLEILDEILLNNTKKENISEKTIIVGGTYCPEKLDPAFISINRFHHILNIRIFSRKQRQSQIRLLCQNKNFIEKKLYSDDYAENEILQRTMGYNHRELTCLVNEFFLLTITWNVNLINTNLARLALDRHSRGYSAIENNTYVLKDWDILCYKVGKGIVQALFSNRQKLEPIYLRYDLIQGRSYYLGKVFLDLPNNVLKEFTIICHLLICFAGIAGRDFYRTFYQRDFYVLRSEASKEVEDDINVIHELSQFLSNNFSWLSIFGEKNQKNIKCAYNEYIHVKNDEKIKTWTTPRQRPKFKWSNRREHVIFASIQRMQNTMQLFDLKYKISSYYNKKPYILFDVNHDDFKMSEVNLELLRLHEPYNKNKFKQIYYTFPEEIKFFIPHIEEKINADFQVINEQEIYENKIMDNTFHSRAIRYFQEKKIFWNRESIINLYKIYASHREDDLPYPNEHLRELIPLSRYASEFDTYQPIIEDVLEDNLELKKKIAKEKEAEKKREFKGDTFGFFKKWQKAGLFLNRTYLEEIEEINQFYTKEIRNERILKSAYLSLPIIENNVVISMIFECYEYLILFFVKNEIKFFNILNDLVKKEILFPEEIINLFQEDK
jgi:hypothetical protein